MPVQHGIVTQLSACVRRMLVVRGPSMGARGRARCAAQSVRTVSLDAVQVIQSTMRVCSSALLGGDQVLE